MYTYELMIGWYLIVKCTVSVSEDIAKLLRHRVELDASCAFRVSLAIALHRPPRAAPPGSPLSPRGVGERLDSRRLRRDEAGCEL